MPATTVHPTAIVDDDSTIGDGTRIWDWVHVSGGAVVGRDCVLGQNVFVGKNVRIGNKVRLQNNVHVCDNAVLEDDVFCGFGTVFAGRNLVMVCGVTIGKFSLISAGCTISRDVAAYSVMDGKHAERVGWISEYGERLTLPLEGSGQAICPASGRLYILENSMCRAA